MAITQMRSGGLVDDPHRAMTTRLYLVRHGATSFTAADRFSGANVELSDEGRWQAGKLGERLSGVGLKAVYASPFPRTVDTATIIAGHCGLQPTLRDELREIDHGHWEGLGRREVEDRFADEYAAWNVDPFGFAPEGGESGVSVLARSLPVIRQIVVAHPDDHVLVVSHNATLRLLICSLLGLDARGYRDRFDLAPASLNVVDFEGPAHSRLMLFNDTSHLTGQPRKQ